MQCPACSDLETRVVDSRSAEGGLAIRRRRECLSCGDRFTTFERVEAVPVLVTKRSGVSEPFDGEKMVSGLSAACKGRPLDENDFAQIAAEIEDRARARSGETSSEWIGLQVLEQLRQRDPVAYLRFASVYKGFSDLADFEREARLIKVAEPSSLEDH